MHWIPLDRNIDFHFKSDLKLIAAFHNMNQQKITVIILCSEKLVYVFYFAVCWICNVLCDLLALRCFSETLCLTISFYSRIRDCGLYGKKDTDEETKIYCSAKIGCWEENTYRWASTRNIWTYATSANEYTSQTATTQSIFG